MQVIADSTKPNALGIIATDFDGLTVRCHWRLTAHVIAAVIQRHRGTFVGYVTPRNPDPNR